MPHSPPSDLVAADTAPAAGRDLILSSGFLAFARHAGVLSALEERRQPVDAVVGTSSGALAGALWCAGLRADTIAAELSRQRPISLMRPNLRPWRGLFQLGGMIATLERLLPPTFAELERPLAVGVIDRAGVYRLLTAGPLPAAVAASCAMPYVFEAVIVGDQPYQDGGTADRLGVDAWRAWRPGRRAIAHQVRRTAGRDVATNLRGVELVETPRSGANFVSLGDFSGQMAEARMLAVEALRPEPGNAST